MTATKADLQEMVRRLEQWWDLGEYATTESRDFANAVRSAMTPAADLPGQETMEEFPDDLRSQIAALQHDPNAPGFLREAACTFLNELEEHTPLWISDPDRWASGN